MRRIAVWNTAFLGDAVLTLPLVQSLKRRYPEAHLDLYVRGGLQSLFACHPDIAAVYAHDKRSKQKGLTGSVRLAREIASRRYDLWISAHQSPRSSFFALASRAAVRIGYKSAAMASLAYTHRVDRRFSELEEVERLLELLKPLPEGPVESWPHLCLAPVATERAGLFFSTLTTPVLGVHPGSVWPTKRWTVEGFADMAARALLGGASVLLFAGPGEEEMAAGVKAAVIAAVPAPAAARLHDLSGSLALPELAAHIARLDCYLTNDSGPMHLAWTQHVPVCAVFGPTVRSLGFYPRGRASSVHEAHLDCRPCGLHGHKSCPQGHHHCMTLIDHDAVWRDIKSKLKI